MPPEAADIRDWLVKALHDWSAARKVLTPDARELDVAGFHCQQAVEKLLKAWLLARGVEFEKTHDLRQLLRQCVALDAEFQVFRADVPPLTMYAIAFRYPGPAEPQRADVEQALALVERVWTFVTLRLPPEAVPSVPQE